MNARTVLRAAALSLSLLAAPSLARAEVLDRVVALIDDDAIFLSEVERYARPYLAEMEATVAADAQPARRTAILRQSLDEMIDERLIQRAATRAHITVEDDDVDRFIANIAQERGADVATLRRALESEGVPWSEYRERMQRQVLQLKVLQLRVRGRINITETDLRGEYTRLARELQGQSIPHVSHIFFALPETASDAQVAAVRARAEAVTARVRGGADFATVARELSEDAASREAGGDLGSVQPGTLPEELERAIDALAVGAVSEPVRGPGGFHVLRVSERTAPAPPSFESVRERLQAVMMNREMFRQRGIYVRELRRAVSIDDRLNTPVPSAPPR